MTDLHLGKSSGSAPTRNMRKRQDGTEPEKVNSKDWTIKGLRPETVDVARGAAKESGMKINAWVAQAFEQAAQAPLLQVHRSTHTTDPINLNAEDEIAWLKAKNDELLETIRNLSTALAKMCS